MKKRLVYLIVVFVVLLISSVIITTHTIRRDYKIDRSGRDVAITSFSVEPEKNLSLNMFDNSFDVSVTIECRLYNDGAEHYVEYVHKSERLEYTDMGTAIIEFEPVVNVNRFKKSTQRVRYHTETFKYTLNGYNYDTKKYIFRCGDFEEVISFYSGK